MDFNKTTLATFILVAILSALVLKFVSELALA